MQLYFLKSTLEPQILAICTRINCTQTTPKRVQSVSDRFHTNLKFYSGEQIKTFLTKYRSYSVCFYCDHQEHKIQSHALHGSNVSTLSLVRHMTPVQQPYFSAAKCFAPGTNELLQERNHNSFIQGGYGNEFWKAKSSSVHPSISFPKLHCDPVLLVTPLLLLSQRKLVIKGCPDSTFSTHILDIPTFIVS